MTQIVIDTLTGKITGSTSTVPVGAFMHVMRATAPDGWVAGDGGTIGAPGSGATRANTDTQDLFNAWWAEFTDAQLPILTVTGAASARGASAAVDWAAGKRLTVFDVRNRVARIAGTSFVNGTKYATTTQDHAHRLPIGWDAGSASNLYMWNDGTGNPVFGSEVVGSVSQSTANKTGPSGGGVRIGYSDTIRSASLSGESAPNTIAMLGCFKL